MSVYRTLKLRGHDPLKVIPAFLTVVFMITSYSISDGIAIGFISYAFAKLASGCAKECPLLAYIFAALFALRYALLPATGAIG